MHAIEENKWAPSLLDYFFQIAILYLFFQMLDLRNSQTGNEIGNIDRFFSIVKNALFVALISTWFTQFIVSIDVK